MVSEIKRVAVVTGANSGIGLAAAKALVAQGWRVIGTGRDEDRIRAATAEIQAASMGAEVDLLRANLSCMAEVTKLADKITSLTDRVDVLINNAGGMTTKFEITDEGLEANFAGNHLGPFLLTDRLLPLLRKTAAAAPPGAVRILMTASYSSEMLSSIDLDDIQNLRNFNPGLAYSHGKLGNVLFTRALATRLAGDGIVAHAVAPGTTASNFFVRAPVQIQEHTRSLPKHSSEVGADTLVWLASADEGGRTSGVYWEKRKPRNHNPLADDPELVNRYWQESEKLVASALAQR
jgi:NAD(P)-dependent dehydrogenase (short-subunit alcohol dehydrogenase family)